MHNPSQLNYNNTSFVGPNNLNMRCMGYYGSFTPNVDSYGHTPKNLQNFQLEDIFGKAKSFLLGDSYKIWIINFSHLKIGWKSQEQ